MILKLRLMQTPLRTMLVLEVLFKKHKYQNADWRLRPLPDEMLRYAREDTHYLLHIYDLMRIRLLSASTESESSDEPLVEGFEVIDIIFDVKHCLQGFVGMAKDLNAIVIAFRGTQERRNWAIYAVCAGVESQIYSQCNIYEAGQKKVAFKYLTKKVTIVRNEESGNSVCTVVL